MLNALIFDLDGTLWDTVAPLTLIWNKVFEKNNTGKVISEDDLRNVMGKNLQEIGRIYFPDMAEERRADIFSQCAVAHCAYLKEYGAPLFFEKMLMEQLAETYELFIVSNCPCGYIEAFLESQNLQTCFKDYEMSGRTGKSKGENIKAVMERNGYCNAGSLCNAGILSAADNLSTVENQCAGAISAKNCVYIGDTAGDEAAAHAAGIPFIYAAYGFGSANNPDAVIHNFNELPEILEKFA